MTIHKTSARLTQFAAATALLLGASPLAAEVTRIIVDTREPAEDGRNGGQHGAYEKITGRLFGAVDPNDRRNAIIQDIALAPRNKNGKVEYISTFTIFRPLDPKRGTGVLMNELPNRGNMTTPSQPRSGMDPLFYDMGYSALWIGWQGDLPEHPGSEADPKAKLQSAALPRTLSVEGKPVTGRYMIRTPTLGGDGPEGGGFTGQILKLDQGRAGILSYFPASFATKDTQFTRGPAEDVMGRPTGPRTRLADSDWTWWNCAADAPAETADLPSQLCVKLLKGELKPTETYTLVFDARDPLVLGLGMAAVRDGVAFFRHAKADSAGAPNPLAGEVQYVVGQGRSQVGNLVKTFISLGFNEDEAGRRVWDGANAHIAGRRTPINFRFAAPGSSATLYMPGSEGVLSWGKDKGLRGETQRSLLDRCGATDTCPKVFETFGSAEIWNQRISPGMVDRDHKANIALPANVRRYYFPGTTHGGGRGGFAPLPQQADGVCALPLNHNPEYDQMRALIVALVDWVAKGAEPPASAYPRLARSELVPDEKGRLHFPAISGVPFPQQLANPVLIYDYGPRFSYTDMSGVMDKVPPAILGAVRALVPQVDGDGNETAGAPSIQHSAPLGTFLGWNVYRAGAYAGQICTYNGGFVPFAVTRAQRLAVKDPRPSLEERYGSRAGYLKAVRAAIEKAKGERLLLPLDGERLYREAEETMALPAYTAMP